MLQNCCILTPSAMKRERVITHTRDSKPLELSVWLHKVFWRTALSKLLWSYLNCKIDFLPRLHRQIQTAAWRSSSIFRVENVSKTTRKQMHICHIATAKRWNMKLLFAECMFWGIQINFHRIYTVQLDFNGGMWWRKKKICRMQDKDKHGIKKRESKMGGNLLSYFRETRLVLKWSDRVDMTGGGVTGTTESLRSECMERACGISNICTGLRLG